MTTYKHLPYTIVGRYLALVALILFSSLLLFHAKLKAQIDVSLYNSEAQVIAQISTWRDAGFESHTLVFENLEQLILLCTDKQWQQATFEARLTYAEILIEYERLKEASMQLQALKELTNIQAEQEQGFRTVAAQLSIAIVIGTNQEVIDARTKIEEYARYYAKLEQHSNAGAAYVSLAQSQTDSADYAAALKNLNLAFKHYSYINDETSLGVVLVSISNVYSSIDDAEKALEYLHRALEVEASAGNTFSQSIILFNMAQAYIANDQLEQASRAIDDSLRLSVLLDDTMGVAWCKQIKAEIALRGNKWHTALKLYEDIAPIFTEAGDKQLLYLNQIGMIKAYLALNNTDKVSQLLKQSEALFLSLEAPSLLLERQLIEAELLFKNEAFKQAYLTLDAAWQVQLKVAAEEKQTLLNKYRVEFDTQLTENQNQNLLAENQLVLNKIDQQEKQTAIWQIVVFGALLGALLLAIFLIQQTRLRKQFALLALNDPLTNQPNRRSVLNFAKQAIKSAVRNKQNITIAIIDLDHFKVINDQFGHDVGDAVLKIFGASCAQELDKHDGFGRYGGEEWLLVLTNCSDARLKSIFERVRQSANAHDINGYPHNNTITFSMGAVTVASDHQVTLSELIAQADKLLYTAKSNGRDCFIHKKASE